MDKQTKQVELSFLDGCFLKSMIALTVDYRGLTVAKATDLRKKLKNAGCEARVVKNTLAKISAKNVLGENGGVNLDKFLATIVGPTMLVYSEQDPIAPAKILSDFAKANEASFKIKGGYFENAFLPEAEVQALSKMPSREEVLSQLLRLINTPATNLVRLLQAPGTQVVRLLNAYVESKEKQS